MQDDKNTVTDSRFNEVIEYQGLSWWKTLIALGILLLIGFGVYRMILANKPEARTFTPPPALVSVEAEQPGLSDYPIKRGDVLLEIDPRNYASLVSSSSANYSQAQANLEQEKAEAAQALKEWQRLDFDGEPSDLVLRKPQLAAAEAAVKSAKAAYDKARLDFSKTTVRAPFDGNIIATNVNVGQFVSTGSNLGEIFSDDGLEVPMPLNQLQYSQLIIENKPRVILSANFGGVPHQWQAAVVRSDNVFDTSTRQLNVTAKITDPISDKGLRLKIGQYLSAVIEGRIGANARLLGEEVDQNTASKRPKPLANE